MAGPFWAGCGWPTVKDAWFIARLRSKRRLSPHFQQGAGGNSQQQAQRESQIGQIAVPRQGLRDDIENVEQECDCEQSCCRLAMPPGGASPQNESPIDAQAANADGH